MLHRRHSERSEESSVALRAAFYIGWILRCAQDDVECNYQIS